MQNLGRDRGRTAECHQRKRERAFLASLRRSLEAGCCRLLKQKISDYGPTLIASADPAVREDYLVVRKEAEKAFETEKAHGTGALLDLDNPIVKALVGGLPGRLPAVSTDEVDAARRYSSIKHQATPQD